MAKSTVAIYGFSSSVDEVTVLREGDVRAASLEVHLGELVPALSTLQI